MFESIMNFFRKLGKSENKETKSKETAKERLHLVLMQDRANVSADFLEMMKQEIIEVIKKYIEVDEKEIDVRLTNDVKEDGTTGSPSLYANIPIMNIKNDMKKEVEQQVTKKEDKTNKEEVKEENKEKETKKEEEGSNKENKETKKSNEEKEQQNKETKPKEVKEKQEVKEENKEKSEKDNKKENNENKSGE